MNLSNALMAAAVSGIMVGATACGGSTPPAAAPSAEASAAPAAEAPAAAPADAATAGDKHGCKASKGCKTSQ